MVFDEERKGECEERLALLGEVGMSWLLLLKQSDHGS
jgi:hypothetical protein